MGIKNLTNGIVKISKEAILEIIGYIITAILLVSLIKLGSMGKYPSYLMILLVFLIVLLPIILHIFLSIRKKI